MKLAANFVVALLSISLVLGGCTAMGTRTMRIDGSSQESTNKSLKLMSESLSTYDLCRLKAAILRIQLGDTSSWKAGNNNQQDNSDPLGSIINGMTFPQIVDLSQHYPDKVGSSCRP